MNPLIPMVLRLLPNILPQLGPLADSLVGKRGRPTEIAENRLYELEKSLQLLAARSQGLERRMKQVRIMSVLSVLLSLGALITVLAR